jgi:hypothetical protein
MNDETAVVVAEEEEGGEPSRALPATLPQQSPGGASLSLFGEEPEQALDKIERFAKILTNRLRQKGMVQELKFRDRQTGRTRNSEHVKIEGWTFVGGLVGVFPVTISSEPITVGDTNGWQATVEARTRFGEIVGRADGMCLRNESRWKDANEQAVRSMAQTRAASKALAQALRFLIEYAGFAGTPAEEMDGVGEPAKPKGRKPARVQVTIPTLELLHASLEPLKDVKVWTVESVLAECVGREWLKEGQGFEALTEEQAQNIILGAQKFFNKMEEEASHGDPEAGAS